MGIFAGVVAFISEYLDSGLGMGYGTALAPVLIIAGYPPLSVVPAILVSQLITDIAACVFHHRSSNVNFEINSRDLKIALLLGTISALGVIASVFIALRVPRWILTLYIGLLVLAMGILILATLKRNMAFSWRKISAISFLASFNKGISGGGYGPLVMGGQLLSGVHAKHSIGITAFAEAITCLVGFCTYILLGETIDWQLTWLLILCATPAVPLAVFTVKKIDANKLKKFVGILIIMLGILTLLKISP